jgi:pimeloyl-ACP methyl ester carboxylesterase
MSTVDVNGTTIHYVREGQGPALVLLHGFPQDWYEWRRVMPRLARHFTVIAVDLRGVGGSAPTAAGYAAADLAEDVHQLIGQLGLGPVHLAAHDVGGWVAYAYARRFPDATRTVTIIEGPIPGIEPWLDLGVDVPLWHGEFHMIPGLPEALMAGRQAIYFRYFFEVGTSEHGVISEADVQHYADAYGDPDRLRSAFEIYRAIPANMAFNAGQTGPASVLSPVPPGARPAARGGAWGWPFRAAARRRPAPGGAGIRSGRWCCAARPRPSGPGHRGWRGPAAAGRSYARSRCSHGGHWYKVPVLTSGWVAWSLQDHQQFGDHRRLVRPG